jgi:hypothetical protein
VFARLDHPWAAQGVAGVQIDGDGKASGEEQRQADPRGDLD